MLKIISQGANKSAIADLERVQQEMVNAALAASADGDLGGEVALALVQMHRYAVANIEEDTGRTKNAIFPQSLVNGNSIQGGLFNNVHYAPYVRDATRTKGFFEYAHENEGPNVLKNLSRNLVLKVNRHVKRA